MSSQNQVNLNYVDPSGNYGQNQGLAGTINTGMWAWSPSLLQMVQLTVDSLGNLAVTGTGGGGGGGSGVQYNQGSAVPVPIGTVAFGQNPSNVVTSLKLDSNNNLNVNVATNVQYVTLVDTTGIYIGEAVPGSTTSSAVWRIQKITIASTITIQWAGGSALFNQVWDNRTSLSYS